MECLNINEPEMDTKKPAKSKNKHKLKKNMVNEVILEDKSTEVTTKPKKSRKRCKENITADTVLDSIIAQLKKKPRYEDNNNTSNIKSKHVKTTRLKNSQSQNILPVESDDIEIPQAYIEWKKENPPKYLNISQQAALDAIQLLEQPEKRSIQKRFNLNCTYKLPSSDCQNSCWDSAPCIISAIRSCILKREFHLLPQFIKSFLQLGFSTHYNHAKELAYLNFLVNADGNGYEDELLDEFVQLFFVRVGRERKENEFDVWYRE